METLKNQIMELVGEASMCWDSTGSAVFDSEKAVIVGEKILKIIEAQREGDNIQGIAVERQNRERQRKYYDAILEVMLRDPLMWEALYFAVNKKEIDYSGFGHQVSTKQP